MIEREITSRLTSLFRQYPFVTVTGPRQSGKTTLCGPLFENAVVFEMMKHRFNRGREPSLYFSRDSMGLECDVLFETGDPDRIHGLVHLTDNRHLCYLPCCLTRRLSASY